MKTRKQTRSQQGFTLIELMIVIAIVGVLTSIALPAYHDYIVRSKISEPLVALAEAKTAVAEYYAINREFPTNAGVFGTETKFFDSEIYFALAIFPRTPTDGVPIRIAVGVYTSVWEGGSPNRSQYGTFQLSGSTNADGSMTWQCMPGWRGSGSSTLEVPVRYLPSNCRG